MTAIGCLQRLVGSRVLPRLLLAMVAILALIAACEQLDVTAVDVMRVEVSPSTATVVVGQSRQLVAVLTDAQGHELHGRTVTWSSAQAGIAEVDGNGQVRGIAPGTAIIRATAEGRTGEATVEVVQPVVATVELSPESLTLSRNEVRQLQATARAADGAPITGLPVTWSSTNTAVAVVDVSGQVTGVAEGETAVSATIGGITDQATVTVLPDPIATIEVDPATVSVSAGDTVRLRATAKANDGVVLVGRPITWTARDPNIAGVSADGLVTGVSEGTTVIIAAAEGKTAEATVTVTPPRVAAVEVTPRSTTIAIGATALFQAVARTADGTALPGRLFTWSSSQPAVATVDANGLATAVALGEASITAATDGITGSATVAVTARPVASVELQPPGGDLFVGDSVTVTATLKAGDGTAVTGRPIAWTTSDPAIASVEAAGATAKIKGLAAGAVTVTATSEGVSADAAFTVRLEPVATVTVEPGSPTVTVDGTVQLQAILRAQDGSALSGRPITWTSDDTGVASVNANGLVRGVAVGSARITATSEGKSGQATVTVSAKPVAMVAVQPAADTVQEGETVQLTAVLTAADGSTLTGRPVTWATSDPAVADVDQAGRVSGIVAGSATITATSEGKSGQASILVVEKASASVEVTPSSAAALPGGTQTFEAVVKAADGTVLKNRRVTWRSLAPAMATVTGHNPRGETATATAVAATCSTGQSCPVTIEAASDAATGTAVLNVLKPVATIELSPETSTVAVGSSSELQATVKAADGTPLPSRRLSWSSNSPANLTVQPMGPAQQSATVEAAAAQCTGVSCSVTVTASAEGVSGTATVVVPKPAGLVEVMPQSLALDEGASAPLQAVVKASDGTVLPNRDVVWSTSAPTIATVTGSGEHQLDASVQAVTCPKGSLSCTATITATADGVPGTASVTVRKVATGIDILPTLLTVAKGRTTAIRAVVTAADGTEFPNRLITWSTANASVASVAPGPPPAQEALVTGVELGETTITASHDGLTGGATVMVVPPVATIDVLPRTLSLNEGDAVQVDAVLRSASGAILTNRPLTWSSTDEAVARVTGIGTYFDQATVTAGRCPIGSATCTASVLASAEEITGSATVTVAKTVATISITPDPPPNLRAGESVQLTAVLHAEDGTNLSGKREVTWSSSNDAVATVSRSGGLVSATSNPCGGNSSCTVTISATVDGRTASVTVRVLE